MTAAAGHTATRTGPGRRSGQLPRFGMAWVTWRQHRMALAGAAALLGGASLFLLINGLGVRGAYASLGLGGCHPASLARCRTLQNAFGNEYFTLALQIPRFLEFLPAFVGAFVGAPLLAREFETGTFRFAWSQGAGRIRWTVAKLALLAVAVTAGALAFSELFSWWYRPFEPVISRMMAGQAFEVEGVVFAARALLAFMLGVLAGALIRRVVPALAATLAGWLAIVYPATVFLRPHYRAPVSAPVGAASKQSDWGTVWTVNQWWADPAGRPVSQSAENALVRRLAARNADPNAWLPQHHYTLWQSYQPASRFWPFQIIEGTGLVLLAVLLGAATVWWVHRRAA